MLPLLAALFLAGARDAPDRGTACASLTAFRLPHATVERAALAEDGATCRVRAVARPNPASRIVIELWMPADWTGRYVQHGNGGFAGNLDQPTLAAEAARGNAVAITDTGHSGDRFDASWAVGRPERVTDYGHRSIKATADVARALLTARYGRPARHRYFVGCSNGGRQALMAAQRYPEDWDGILAGAPANLWTRQLEIFAVLQHDLRTRPGAWLAAAKLPAIQNAALAACPVGTVAGGVALRPDLCAFDPSTLQCRGADAADCLTPAHVESVRRIAAAGFEPTSAAGVDGWAQWIVNPDPAGPSQLLFAIQALRHLFGGDRGSTIDLYDPARDRASPRLRRLLDADSVDFRRFRSRGGRILSYFGWADALISPREGLAYYRRVVGRMGGTDPVRDFYRLFMVPGMAHCQGGAGATSFGQSLDAPALGADRDHDVRLALEAWVERHIAPDRLIAAGGGATRSLHPTD